MESAKTKLQNHYYISIGSLISVCILLMFAFYMFRNKSTHELALRNSKNSKSARKQVDSEYCYTCEKVQSPK